MSQVLRCQFCEYTGPGWTEEGQKCPRCGELYDWLLAQDNEE